MFTKKVISRMIKGPILHIFGSKIILLFVKILSYMGSYRRRKKMCCWRNDVGGQQKGYF